MIVDLTETLFDFCLQNSLILCNDVYIITASFYLYDFHD